MDALLNDVYYNVSSSPASFCNVNAIYQEAKKRNKDVKFKDVEEFLQKQDTYTLHKKVEKNFSRKRMFAAGVDTDWQADLCDMQKLSKHNRGYNYILVVIDVLSKYAWAVPIKNKQAVTTAKAFQHVLDSSDRRPWRLYTDKGNEFRGSEFQKLLHKRMIQYISSESPDVKAAVAERFIRTLKSRLWKYFTTKKTFCYLDVLPEILDAYNHSFHSSIKTIPAEVDINNESVVREQLYGKERSRPPVQFKFNVGDRVRIAKYRHQFKKGYLPNFTEEIFVIKRRYSSHPPTYQIEDLAGEEVAGIFYEPELVKVVKTDDDVYKIEKVIQKRKKRGVSEVLVKWLGYPDKFNQWIKETDLMIT